MMQDRSTVPIDTKTSKSMDAEMEEGNGLQLHWTNERMQTQNAEMHKTWLYILSLATPPVILEDKSFESFEVLI